MLSNQTKCHYIICLVIRHTHKKINPLYFCAIANTLSTCKGIYLIWGFKRCASCTGPVSYTILAFAASTSTPQRPDERSLLWLYREWCVLPSFWVFLFNILKMCYWCDFLLREAEIVFVLFVFLNLSSWQTFARSPLVWHLKMALTDLSSILLMNKNTTRNGFVNAIFENI